MSLVTEDHVLLDCDAVHGYVERVCFKTGPPRLVGTELEWLVAFESDPGRLVPVDLMRTLLDSVSGPPNASRITFEPGGQLELSSPPEPSAAACWRSLAVDVEHVRRPLADAGLVFLPTAVDPHRCPQRQLSSPRYAAMERYFEQVGADVGPAMMNSTAAVQVNLDIGADLADATRRWDLLHAIGPLLAASFANSPVQAGRRTGWKSTRQRIWQRLDNQRTSVPAGADPVTAWADYVLDAELMFHRHEGADWPSAGGATFRDWVTGDVDLEPATVVDLDYHLTTLFPPVRPRGWFEVRYLDAQPPGLWPVPMAVLSALVDDAEAAEDALAIAEPVTGSWETAARDGLADPALAMAANGCFETAIDSMIRNRADADLLGLVLGFADQYVSRGRCPADDTLDAPRATPDTREPA